MKAYIAQRLVVAVLTLFGMSVVIFVLFPGVAISLAVFGSNLFGDALRDTLDPRLRGA